MSGHEHHHEHSWQAELEAYRDDVRHYYLHEFDWRGEQPPAGFEGPRFFPPAEEWRLEARLDRDVPGVAQSVTLPTSTGQLRQMSVAGQLVFAADGREQRLTAYRTHAHHGEPATLFVPFRDATSGSESYGAGRYVDLPYEETDELVELDFNYAYNPSCVYSAAYDCPFPPPGNRLEVAVRAGEAMPYSAAS